jgi:hypothetical protein
MANKIGQFITSPVFMKVAKEAVTEAVADAEARGLPRAYTPLTPAQTTEPNTSLPSALKRP